MFSSHSRDIVARQHSSWEIAVVSKVIALEKPRPVVMACKPIFSYNKSLVDFPGWQIPGYDMKESIAGVAKIYQPVWHLWEQGSFGFCRFMSWISHPLSIFLIHLLNLVWLDCSPKHWIFNRWQLQSCGEILYYLFICLFVYFLKYLLENVLNVMGKTVKQGQLFVMQGCRVLTCVILLW